MAVEMTGLDTDTLASDLRGAVALLTRRLRRERPDHELGPTKMAVLSRLYRLGPSQPGALAADEHVQPQSMARALGNLEDLGLVHRSAHPTDGRQVVITLSEAGSALVESDRQQRDEWLASAIETHLCPTERAVLGLAVTLLTTLAESSR